MKNKGLILIGSTLLAVLLVAIFIKKPVIQFAYDGGVFYLNEEFEIGWIHSVEKEPWFEKYELQDGSLVLTETRFKTFGAGTPSTGEVIPSNDGFVHLKVNRKMDAVHLTVSEKVQTTLYTKNKIIPLNKLTADHETVVITIEKLPIWQILRGDLYDGRQ